MLADRYCRNINILPAAPAGNIQLFAFRYRLFMVLIVYQNRRRYPHNPARIVGDGNRQPSRLAAY